MTITPTDLPTTRYGEPALGNRTLFLTQRPPIATTRRRPLTAAATRVDLSASSAAQPTRAKRQEGWQSLAWGYRDEVGEVRYAYSFKANVSARMRLFAAVAAPEGEDPVPVDQAVEDGLLDAQLAADARAQIARLAEGRVHAGKLLGPFAELWGVAGECYIVGRLMPDGGELWSVYSVDEVQQDDQGWYLAAESERGSATGGGLVRERLDPETAYVARIWRPHPRWSQRADSPMRALLDTCEELLRIGRAIRAELRSRVHAGILYAHTDVVNAARIGSDIEDVGAVPPLVEDLADSLTSAVTDESALETLVPTILTGSLPFKDAIGHLSLARTADSSLLDRQRAALTRLGMGLDVPPEIITGLAAVNHWTGWLVDDSTFRNHVEPDVQAMVDALTVSMFRDALVALGHARDEVDRLIVWYDPSDAVTAPNRGAEADAAFDRGSISEAAYRTARGFDDTDEPDDEERVRRFVLGHGAVSEETTRAVLSALLGARALPAAEPAETPALPAPAEPDPETPEDNTETPGPDETPGEPASVSASGYLFAENGPELVPVTAASRDQRAERLSRQLAAIDRDLRARLHGAADAALARALERAGNKVRASASRHDRALHASLRGVDSQLVPAHVGREAITAALGLSEQDLLDQALDVLAGQWSEWVGAASLSVVALVGELAGWSDTDPRRARLAARLGEGVAAGWSWLRQRLTELASRLMFDPADPDGEPQQRGVPYGLIRGAVAVAGGLDPSSGGVTDQGLPAVAGRPVGGLAYGDAAGDSLREAGVTEDGYEWVYGISDNPFQPHRRLDGLRFDGFADPALNTTEDTAWLGPIYLPGDHAGCSCSYVVLFDTPDGPVSPELDAEVEKPDSAAMEATRALALADIAAGRYDTAAVREAMQAERIANSRPSQPAPTPITDAVNRARAARS